MNVACSQDLCNINSVVFKIFALIFFLKLEMLPSCLYNMTETGCDFQIVFNTLN